LTIEGLSDPNPLPNERHFVHALDNFEGVEVGAIDPALIDICQW
jgi:hypothetical protein